eukprot:CAMPEP_0183403390 /NCGR_PEP_ID=MMETSP0370-20130417/14541_1 /TAXON_ID=268820 /ORGANISM="Peridinium aciculiferum, Strain PAER-2" /LENGTH=179 /DNA_ID=CAMNT_0025585131 /DNA_START=111 /DNA_END=647 /DNA_ORIENTATION=+
MTPSRTGAHRGLRGLGGGHLPLRRMHRRHGANAANASIAAATVAVLVVLAFVTTPSGQLGAPQWLPRCWSAAPGKMSSPEVRGKLVDRGPASSPAFGAASAVAVSSLGAALPANAVSWWSEDTGYSTPFMEASGDASISWALHGLEMTQSVWVFLAFLAVALVVVYRDVPNTGSPSEIW